MARITGASSEVTEEHEKWYKLSAYHHWDQQGCVRVEIWICSPFLLLIEEGSFFG
jgi:hypothetical protein